MLPESTCSRGFSPAWRLARASYPGIQKLEPLDGPVPSQAHPHTTPWPQADRHCCTRAHPIGPVSTRAGGTLHRAHGPGLGASLRQKPRLCDQRLANGPGTNKPGPPRPQGALKFLGVQELIHCPPRSMAATARASVPPGSLPLRSFRRKPGTVRFSRASSGAPRINQESKNDGVEFRVYQEHATHGAFAYKMGEGRTYLSVKQKLALCSPVTMYPGSGKTAC